MKRWIAASLSSLLWGLFVYLGYDGMKGIIRQHAPGYPNAGQWHYYVHFPMIILLINVALLLFAKKLPAPLFIAVWALQAVAFVPFLLGYGGGV